MGLIICGEDYPIDAKIVNYRENGWDATIEACVPTSPGASTGCSGVYPFAPKSVSQRTARYSTRHALRQYGRDPKKIPLAAVQAVVKQFIVHHDGLAHSWQCFHVLQNERGLSCHFLIDNDGTIYQTLDLALCGFHASEFNPISVGVEMANRGEFDGQVGKYGQYYADKKRFPDEHPETYCIVRNSKIHCYDFTKAQFDSFKDLAKALTKLLPGIALDYPQDVPGHVNRGLQPNPWSFSGYIGHMHLTNRKWDPGPFDFKKFIDDLRGSLCFPLWTGRTDTNPKGLNEKPLIPDSIDELGARTQALYDVNEHKSEGGYFPVGPWGDSRLWHGGVHIPQFGNGPPASVYAPFPGRLVLARMGAPESSVGSVNFVLLRHEMMIGPRKLRFYSLYMHLLDELKQPAQVPPWLGKEGWLKEGKKGELVVLDEPIEAGEIIGRFGTAGPSEISKKQIHFEIFSKEPVYTDEDSKWWTPYDGSATGRFCEIPEIVAPIDTKTVDGILQREELTDFFDQSGDRASFRKLVAYNISEWTDRPDWGESLRTPPDFRDMADEIDAMVEDQIKPGLWWTEKIARELRLPPDGMVYHYHPLTFIQWINEKILEAASDPNEQDTATTEGTAGMTADFESESNDDSDMFNEAVAEGRDPLNDAIDLRHLVEGYNGEPELD